MALLKDSLITGDLRVTGTIYGNTTSADKLSTARTINGTSFDGTANITTANWGTARTVSIGSAAGTTGTSVNGSANVTLTIPSTMTGFTSISSTTFVGALTGHASSDLALTGGTLSGDLLFSNPGATATRQIRLQCADNDYGRIAVGGTASNSGYMEIATADDANEPIYVRQYSGVYTTLNTTLTLLDASHNTTIPGRLTMSGGQPINQILTGTGTAATTSGSNYVPAKWTFNTGRAVVDGDIYTIKIPVAGHDYGIFMSVNNGTNYYPVVISGTGRVTTHYPVNTYIQVVFEASGSAASMFPLAGGTSRVTVSGGVFRVLNYYDSGNSGLYQNYNPKAFKIGATATTAYDLLAEDATGLIVPAHKIAHRVGSPIYIASSAKAANATGTWWDMYQRHYSMLIRKDGTNLSTTAYNPIYLKGTIANGMFTPDTTTPYVFTKAGCNVTGAYYMFVGDAQTSASYINYNDSHPYYYYDGSNLLLYTEYTTVASKLATARSLKVALGSTTAVTFDGSAAQDSIPVSGTLKVANGGTGATTFTSGNVLVGAGTNAVTTIAKTSANTANTLVQRDGSGNFSAGTITASLTGHASLDLPLAGGTMTGQIKSTKAGGSWIQGRNNACLYQTLTTSNNWHPVVGFKTPSGSWTIGNVGDNENCVFSYDTDTNFNANTNTTIQALYFDSNGYIHANRVYNAVWNDYAEYRTYNDGETPYGRVICENGDDSVSLSTKRLQPGAMICSDTFGTCMGDENGGIPIAVAGRVLAYPLEPREEFNFFIGQAVCAGPNGTVSIMTKDEVKEYPECVVGYISAVPQYEEWGQNKIKVDGRIWIKVK